MAFSHFFTFLSLGRMGDRLRKRVDFECERDISGGAYGMISAGYLLTTGEPVAVKKGKRQHLKDEYDILKSLKGTSHIVQVFGYDEDPTHYYIVMERARCSLDKLISKVPYKLGLPAIDIVKLISDLGIALDILLKRQVIHRDIKPQNILVFSGATDPNKSQFFFKLCDFGFARETTMQNEECFTIAGTPPFLHPRIFLEYMMHPSKLRMSKPYPAEICDLWSIGATIFNACTGRLPFPQVTGEFETRVLHDNRPQGAICAVAQGGKYFYYDTIRADTYPRWLRQSLSRLISSQFDAPSYDTFLGQCSALSEAAASQRRLVLLPALTPTVHYEIDERIIPGANIQMHSLFGLAPVSITSFLSRDGISTFGIDLPLSLGSVKGETLLVWNESGKGLNVEHENMPPRPLADTQTGQVYLCVQECHDLIRQCDDVVEAWQATVQITRENVERSIIRVEEMTTWLHSVRRNEEQASSLASIAAIVNAANCELLERIKSAPVETMMRAKDIDHCRTVLGQLSESMKAWTELDERPIPNCLDAMSRLSDRPLAVTDARWEQTFRDRIDARLRALRTDCERRVRAPGGVAAVIRDLVRVDGLMCDCVRKMRDTVGVVGAVSDEARKRVGEYMRLTTGMDDAEIRKNLTNNVFAMSMIKHNVEKQAELTARLEEVMSRLNISIPDFHRPTPPRRTTSIHDSDTTNSTNPSF